MKLSEDVRSAIRHFVFYVHNGTVDFDIMGNHDYRKGMMTEASLMEAAYTIFINNLEVADDGKVLNFSYAKKRAAIYLRSVTDRNYEERDQLENWEVELPCWS